MIKTNKEVMIDVTGCYIKSNKEIVGASGSGNVISLSIRFNDQWDDMLISVRFTDARGDSGITTSIELVEKSMDGSYKVLIPHEAMAYAGMAELTFYGVIISDGVVSASMTTRPMQFRVYDSTVQREAQSVEQITLEDKQRIMSAVDSVEAYSCGTIGGVPVSIGQPGYNDNAKYYKDLAEHSSNEAGSYSNSAATSAGESALYMDSSRQYANNAREYSESASMSATNSSEYAHTAERYANDAKTAAESMHYNIERSFPKETVCNASEIVVDSGADNIPITDLVLTYKVSEQTAADGEPVVLDIFRYGRNLCDTTRQVRFVSFREADGVYCRNKYYGYEFFLPQGVYRLRAFKKDPVQSIDGIILYGTINDKYGNYIKPAPSTTASFVSNGTTRDRKVQIDKDCKFIIWYTNSQASQSEAQAVFDLFNLQIEPWSDHDVGYEEYSETNLHVAVPNDVIFSGGDTVDWDVIRGTITINGDAVYNVEPRVLHTLFGINCFCTSSLSRLNSNDISIKKLTYCIDPTSIYEKLKAAIVAIGS